MGVYIQIKTQLNTHMHTCRKTDTKRRELVKLNLRKDCSGKLYFE